MAAFVGPRIAGSMSNMNLKTASKKVAATLRYARSQAISESRTYVALFNLDRNSITIKAGKTVGDEEKEKDGADGNRGGDLSRSYDLPEEVKIEKCVWADGETESGLFQIVFLSNGGSSGGEVFLCNDRGNRYEIKVDFITGTVRLGAVSSEQ